MNGKKTVLVIEDEPHAAAILGRRLENLGYRVVRAPTAKRGTELLNDADLVFLDLRLPDLDGEAWLERVRASGNYIPVVVMSAAMSRQEAQRRLDRFRIVDFMEKPFTLQEVAEKAGRAAEISDQMQFVGDASNRLKGFIERQNGIH